MAYDNITTGTTGDDDLYPNSPTGSTNITYGRAGDDILRGGPGNDTFVSGGGNDKFWGGGGADTFIFDAAQVNGVSKNAIYDLSFAEGDRIGLNRFGEGQLGNNGDAGLKVLDGGQGVILDSVQDIASLVAGSNGNVTVAQKGTTDVLVLRVTDSNGDVLQISISNIWSQYEALVGGLEA